MQQNFKRKTRIYILLEWEINRDQMKIARALKSQFRFMDQYKLLISTHTKKEHTQIPPMILILHIRKMM